MREGIWGKGMRGGGCGEETVGKRDVVRGMREGIFGKGMR